MAGVEGEEVGEDAQHAEGAHHHQRHAEERDTVAGGNRSAGLIIKGVAQACPSWHSHPTVRAYQRVYGRFPAGWPPEGEGENSR